MNSINDERGCSVCQPGKENYTTYTTKLGRKRERMYQCIRLVHDNKPIVVYND